MKARIVVIEDEPEIQGLIAEELEDAGYEVARASNGREGLDLITAFKPHLILSDISMPEMDGYELLEALRDRNPRFQGVPIIFLSALADRRHVIHGKKLGADDYVTKPIDFELLLATVGARLREVERLTDLKERQMAKLYQTFITRAEAAGRPKPALVVVNQWLDLNPVHAAFEQLDVAYVVHHRGARLDAYLNGRDYSAVIISDHTDDVSAKMALMSASAVKFHKGPVAVLVEDPRRPGRDELEALAPLINLQDCPEALTAFLAAHIKVPSAA